MILVVRPPLALAKAPLPFTERIRVDSPEQRPVKGMKLFIDGLFRASAEENRKPHLPPLKLAFIEQSGAGNRSLPQAMVFSPT